MRLGSRFFAVFLEQHLGPKPRRCHKHLLAARAHTADDCYLTPLHPQAPGEKFAAALAAKEDDVVGIDLRVVAEDGLNSLSGGILSHTHTTEVRVSVSGCWGVSPREIPLRPIPS